MSSQEPEDDKLPGIAGAIEAAANSKPVSALLTPAAEVFGQHFRQLAVEWVDRRNAKRRIRLRQHFAVVESVKALPAPENLSDEQMEFAFNWADSAQDIDPDIDPDTAAIWRALLASIFSGSSQTKAIRNAISRLESQDAAFLLQKSDEYRTRNAAEVSTVARLQAAGILFKLDRTKLYIGLAALGPIFFAIGVFIRPPIEYVAKLQPYSSYIDGGMGLIGVALFMFWLWANQYFELTELGREIKRQGMLFKAASHQRER
jgi:hypothetical protein